MSTTVTTTRITYKYLMSKSKSELADMVLTYSNREANLTRMKYVILKNATDDLVEQLANKLRHTCYELINEMEKNPIRNTECAWNDVDET